MEMLQADNKETQQHAHTHTNTIFESKDSGGVKFMNKNIMIEIMPF